MLYLIVIVYQLRYAILCSSMRGLSLLLVGTPTRSDCCVVRTRGSAPLLAILQLFPTGVLSSNRFGFDSDLIRIVTHFLISGSTAKASTYVYYP